MRIAVAALVVSVSLVLGGAARAEGPRDEARAHFSAGEKRFQAGDYRGAIAEFKAADALVPSPILSYNVALCHDRLGEAREAVSLYRAYLAKRPDAPNRTQVEARIAALSSPQPLDPWAGAPPPAAGQAPRAPAAAPPLPARPPAAAAPPVGPATPAPEGDGLAAPRPGLPAAGAPAPPGAAPQPRAYDDVFGRRIPGRNAEAAPRTAAPPPAAPPAGEGPAAEAAPAPPSAGPPGAGELPGPGLSQSSREPLPPPAAPESPKRDTPIYAKWWFWAVIGVGAFIAVDVAVHAGNDSSASSRAKPGLVLFHF